jgi:hypothetical protein
MRSPGGCLAALVQTFRQRERIREVTSDVPVPQRLFAPHHLIDAQSVEDLTALLTSAGER